MIQAKILDCTLRDGGYINQWKFGSKSISRIISKLAEAKVDIIECGFLRDVPYSVDASVFSSIEQIAPFIAPKQAGTMYVAMIAIGEIPPEKISPRSADSIDGIRLTFHKHEIDFAFEVGKKLADKGYEVFMQPVGTASYSDAELLDLIQKINIAQPFAFYIVDTLGSMYKSDVVHMFHLCDRNLNAEILLGFHSHNNLQLAFSNAQALLELNSKRVVILDTSVYGMGRGAGNLCTELVTQYLNDNTGTHYSIVPQLEIIDDHLNEIYGYTAWGYTVPFCLAAMKQCHPNYVEYLTQKQTLSMKPIAQLLDCIPAGEGMLFNKQLIETIYTEYQSHAIDDAAEKKQLASELGGRPILIIAPGLSIEKSHEEINAFMEQNHPIVIPVNFLPEAVQYEYVFISNKKRFETIARGDGINKASLIVTSNLYDLTKGLDESMVHMINYSDYIVPGAEGDNSGLMLIRLLIRLGCKDIALAGFDGFVAETQGNFYNSSHPRYEQQKHFDEKNANIKKQFDNVRHDVTLQFITPSLYE